MNEKLNVKENETIPERLDFKDSTIDAIFTGMESVTGDSGGTAYNTFKDFPIKVAGKTGSVQVSGSSADNAWFIGFAPYDNPQIAVAVVLEHGATSSYAAKVAKSMYECFLGTTYVGDEILPYNKLLR